MSIKQYFPSMESAEEEIVDVNETLPVEVSADNTLEEEIAEVKDATIEVVEAEDDVEQLKEIAAGLESIVVSLEQSLEDGGLGAQSAIFMNHAVAGYTARLGLESDTVVASLESFGGASGQAAATTVSMEGVKETLQRVVKAIQEAIKKAIAATANLFNKLFGGFEKLKARATALKQAAKDLDSKATAKESEIEIGAAHNLMFKGKVDSASVVNGMSETASLSGDLFSKYVPGVKMTLGNIAKQISTNTHEDPEKIGEQINKIISDFTKGYSGLVGKEIIGGGKFEAKGDAAEGEWVVPGFSKESGSADAKVKVLSPAEMEKVCSSVETLCDLFLKGNVKNAVKEMRDAREASVKKINEVLSLIASNKMDELVGRAVVNSGMKVLNKNFEKPLTEVSSASFNGARAALAYVDRSLKQYAVADAPATVPAEA